jgi:predicted Fe-Mo cluster-binding NifX family protein
MKVAVVSEDGARVSEQFGGAALYVVFTIRKGKITAEERRPKLESFWGQPDEEAKKLGPCCPGTEDTSSHRQMVRAISDCQVLVAGSMERDVVESLQELGIRVVVTDIEDARDAALRCAKGNLPNLVERRP